MQYCLPASRILPELLLELHAETGLNLRYDNLVSVARHET
jgi:hypothetical protein